MQIPIRDVTGAPSQASDGCARLVDVEPLELSVATRLAEQFHALADPHRLQLLSIVAGADSACVCDLTELVDLTQGTVSHHLRILVEAGLLQRERHGKWVHYRVAPEAATYVQAVLASPLPGWLSTRIATQSHAG